MKLELALEEKRDIENKIKSVKNDLAKIPKNLPFNMNLQEWKLRLESLLNKHNNDLERVLKIDAGYYHQFKDNIDKISAELESRKKIELKARAELSDLNKKLETLDLQLSMKDLLVLQDKLATLKGNIDSLNQVVVSEQEKINEIENRDNATIAVLIEERENLLADIASGLQVESGQVEKIEKKIAREKAGHKKSAAAISTAKHTISGLNRRIAKAEIELSLAKSNFKDAVILFLKSQIDNSGTRYVDFAEKLATEFTRICSMASICETLGESADVYGPYSYQFQIPSFALEVCQEKELIDMAGMLFRFASVNRQEAKRIELDYFAGLGLNIPA